MLKVDYSVPASVWEWHPWCKRSLLRFATSVEPSVENKTTKQTINQTNQNSETLTTAPKTSKESNRKEGNVLFNVALNTFYLQLYGDGHMVKDHSDRREETCCRHKGYSFRLTARVLLYAPSHRQDSNINSWWSVTQCILRASLGQK